MELREYIKIIQSNKLLFFGLWLAVIFLTLVWYFSRPVTYESSMSIEISRLASQQTDDYQYDQYYRLEADNRFADTVVQWLKDPSVVSEVYSQAGLNVKGRTLKALSKSLAAEKLSANYIQVRFASTEIATSEKLSQFIKFNLDKKVEGLNKESVTENWFRLIYGVPITTQARISFAITTAAAVLSGLLVSFLAVLLKHYWQAE